MPRQNARRRRSSAEVAADRKAKELERENLRLRSQLGQSQGQHVDEPVPVRVVDDTLEYKRFGPNGEYAFPVVAGVMEVPATFDVNLLPPGTVYRKPDELPQKRRKMSRAEMERKCDAQEDGFRWVEFEPSKSQWIQVDGVSYWVQAGGMNRVPSPIFGIYQGQRADEKGLMVDRDGNEYLPASGSIHAGTRRLTGQVGMIDPDSDI